GPGKRFSCCDARRDVRERGDYAALRHAIDAYLDNEAAIGKALQEWLQIGRVVWQPLAHQRLRIPGSEGAAFGVKAENFRKVDTDAYNFMRQLKQFAKLLVPANEVRVLIEYRNTLPHMIERGLQNLAVIVDGGIGIVEQFQCRLSGNRTLTQQQR